MLRGSTGSADAASVLNRRHVRAAFTRAAEDYDAASVLCQRVGDELVERLDVVSLKPRRIVDLGSGTGYCARLLEKRYRGAQVVTIDSVWAMLRRAGRRRRWGSRQRPVLAEAEAVPLSSASADLVFSNLALPWCDIPGVLAEAARLLRPHGLLSFSTFGPDTLIELRQAWASVDAEAHVQAFPDMHDIGDVLLETGFADPVVDVDRTRLVYDDVSAALLDLRRFGLGNVLAQRRPTLTAKGRFAAFRSAYDRLRDAAGRIPATFEIIYGHAWAPAGAPRRGPRGASAGRVDGLRVRSP